MSECDENNVFSKIGKIMSGIKVPKIDVSNLKINPEIFETKRPYEHLINDKAMKELAKVGQERWEREEQVAKAIKAVAEIQPQIANALGEMASETQKASKHQRRVNWAIIVISGTSLLIGIIGILIAKGIM